MPRVNFADSSPNLKTLPAFTDEHAPLLRPLSYLPPVSEENEDDDNELQSSTASNSPTTFRFKHKRLYSISRGSKGELFSPERRDYLPLHSRRICEPEDVPAWKTVVTVIGALIVLLCIILATLFLDGLQRPSGPFPRPPLHPGDSGGSRNPAFLITARNGAVASENIVCSELGVDVLKDGGNAVDAAVAVTFCIGVVNLFSSGIGGGGFMTVRIPPTSENTSSTVWTIDFRETAPAKANKTMFVDDPRSSKIGGLSVGVPGEIRGLQEAHTRWGSLPWDRLVQPSVELASGWVVGRELGNRIELFSRVMLGLPPWRAIFAPNGTLLRTGDLIRRSAYSRTLATIASEGPDAFYEGPLADAIVDAVQSSGGIVTAEDMASYKVKVLPALTGTYLGRKVYTTHAPTSGPVLLHMLNLLERYDLNGEGRTGLNTHRFVETMKFGFAARTKICDPDFTNDTARITEISSKSYSKLIFANITDGTTHTPDYYNPVFDVPEDHGTSHTSVIDKNGMAVALTSTVNLVFGSLVLDPVTGILFNDEMDDFSTPGTPNAFGLWPSPYNYPEPGKRPLSSTVPTIMEHEDGSFYLAAGGSGGTKIFPAVLQTILSIDQWGLDVSQAVEAGRVHDQLYPLGVEVDSIVPEEKINALVDRGHNVTVLDINRIAAVVQAVVQSGEVIYAASDSRKNGIAAGY